MTGFDIIESKDVRALDLTSSHRAAIANRKRRIVVQYDAYHIMRNYAKLHPETPFDQFRDGVFSYIDEPGSQIDAVWWDIGGTTPGPVYPSQLLPSVEHPLLKRWLSQGIDWVDQFVRESRRRSLEVFWSHRISEVDGPVEGGLEMKCLHPLKAAYPDWTVPASFWWQGLWNLASAKLREHKVNLLRELVTNYDFDGIQIDFARHVPCLPVGKQWELRGHVTQFMYLVRKMLLSVAEQRGRPILLAAKVPQSLEGCKVDGFDVWAWAEKGLVDILTLGSRAINADLEDFRKVVGDAIQLQPCSDDHHAPDGYRYPPLEVMRGLFANHLQRGANSVVVFNWSVAPPEVCRQVGADVGPLAHQEAFKEIGSLFSMEGKDKIFAIDRRGGYPWADGFFNRNDEALLPMVLSSGDGSTKLRIHVSDSPKGTESCLFLRCVIFGATEKQVFEVRFNGILLCPSLHDPEWKDPQIHSPEPQPISGGPGDYRVDPRQSLLCVEYPVPHDGWQQGFNEVEIHLADGLDATTQLPQLEKLEAHLRYS